MKFLCLLPLAAVAFAQPQPFTLAEAEALALRNHPTVAAARLSAEAEAQVPQQVRSALAPQLGVAVSGAAASERARIGAGVFTNPLILSRVGLGTNFSQLLYDGGRTKLLTEGATARAKSEAAIANATRAQVLLQVRQAYLLALRTQAILRVATQTISARQTVLDQVSALTDAKLKSGLDLSFAEVAVAEARLLAAQARNDSQAALADLAVAVGLTEPAQWVLTDPPPPPALPADSQALFGTALRQRPELEARRLEVEAAQRLVAAEGKLTKPTVSGFGTAGVVPAHVVAYEKDFYAAAGLSVNLNFFNGGLFAARRTEAALRARAAEQRLKELENRLAREVAVAYLNAQTAFERLSLTDQLLKRAALSLELAQARYDLGLSSIVELSQAQLSKTTAELQQASARYDYAAQTAALSFQLGTDFN